MSYFVTVTFDLNGANTNVYPKIHSDLENLDFSKFVTGRKQVDNQLPSNTFVADFDVENFDRPSEITNWLKSEIKKIFKKHHVSGKYFIAVGKRWAWTVGSVM